MPAGGDGRSDRRDRPQAGDRAGRHSSTRTGVSRTTGSPTPTRGAGTRSALRPSRATTSTTPRGAAGYFGYFGGASPGYRVMTLNGWRVYLLNSNCGDIDCDKQKTWLRNDLVAHPVACSAIALHYPRYSSGQHGSARTMAKFWNIAYQPRRRSGPRRARPPLRAVRADGRRGQPGRGRPGLLRGRHRRQVALPAGWARQRPARAYFRADRFGVLQLKLGTGEFGWRFRTIAGTVRDSGSRPCH